MVCEVGSKVNRLLSNYVKLHTNTSRESNSLLYMRFDFKEFYMEKHITQNNAHKLFTIIQACNRDLRCNKDLVMPGSL